MWGNARILEFLDKQRALYKYIHDQSVRSMNEGYTGVEISNLVKLPPELDKLDELPPAGAAAKYVEYMGGANAVLNKAKADYDNGNYRWVAMALKHVVFADPDNTAAKNLLADAYGQMGYQAESGPWRHGVRVELVPLR